MSDTPNTTGPTAAAGATQPSKLPEVFVHRVCTQCNNMFRTPADKFDVKQCPNCHKG